MSETDTLNIVFCWHMHQPDYRDHLSGQYQQPWTYLHAIKDYADMAAHLEKNPQARVVVNFAPILLQQIDDYAKQVQRYFTHHVAINDPLLHALAEPTLSSTQEHRHSLINACMRANEQHLVKPFEHYHHLYLLAKRLSDHPHDIAYLNNQYFVDLLMWYHLAWLGEHTRRDNMGVKQLIAKARGFTLHDRRQLLSILGDVLASIIPRYRKLSEQGQVELSLSPYSHPIVPLLLDMSSAQQSMPDLVLPLTQHYPGGEQRAAWHIERGIEVFEQHFGITPQGCWLSEGGLSDAAVTLLDRFGFAWTAGGESVLRHSLIAASQAPAAKETFLYQPYQFNGKKTSCFFRDDELSDLIGFSYSDWHGDDAAANLVHRLESIAESPDTKPGSVVSLILDGENAWEYYPNNAYYFINALYQMIASSEQLAFATFADCAQQHGTQSSLQSLVAGSWVYGTFSTWIGDEQKNRGWEMLIDAKHCFDKVMASGMLNEYQQQQAIDQLAMCESSDWFWWFGDYNPADTVSDFDRLFRMHLANLYQYLNESPPDYITEMFTHGSGNPLHGGVMRMGAEGGG